MTVDPNRVPSGGIIMWEDANNIPQGWFLCDGSNGTPDLRDKFIVGAGSTYNSGDTGGATTHTLTTAEMPAHTHSTGLPVVSGGDAYGAGDGWASDRYSTSSGTSGSTGSGNAHNNLPPYYALVYIKKS